MPPSPVMGTARGIWRPPLTQMLTWNCSPHAAVPRWARSSALSDETVQGVAIAPVPQAGFDIETSGLLAGNTIHLSYTDSLTGKVHNVSIVRVDDPSAFGCVVHDGADRISACVEKPPKGTEPTNAVNAGTYLFEREVLDMIPAGRNVSIERETFPLLIAGTQRVFAVSTDDYWIDVGRPETYVQAHRDILDGKFEKPLGVEIRPRVWSADGAPIDCATLRGPAYIGAGAKIARGAAIEPYAVIYDDVSVANGARIDSSILWPGCVIGADAVVRGAILGLDVLVDAGATVPAGSVIGKGERLAHV